MAKGSQNKNNFVLEIPLDASEIEDIQPRQALKVGLRMRDGSMRVETVRLDKNGQGTATFIFAERPGSMQAVVGPETASDEELVAIQTITRDVSARQWADRDTVTLSPVVISAYYWYGWLRWCRTFTIRGRVVCPDGQAVPGAHVCAYDKDWWWWWSSSQQVGCDTTDANGAFEITFRWCCGWWPWWWWRHRVWQLEPVLAERLMPVLQRELPGRQLPSPTPKPSMGVFAHLLADEGILTRAPETTIDPGKLDGLRHRLLERFTAVPELEHLRLWPWYPWYPWWDCTPDIIFKVTQNCLGDVKTIVDENIFDTRWDIPQTLEVTLVANEEACCIPPPCEDDCPEGDCLLITHACGDPIFTIGGNPGAAATPAGYRNPGLAATHGDRPYAGTISIGGVFGDLTNVDYYEFEWSGDGGVTWDIMPAPPATAVSDAAPLGFTRVYYGPEIGTGDPAAFHPVNFDFNLIDGRYVIESREHFEANNDPASWGITRFWVTNVNMLMRWRTELHFPDDTYQLRLRSWNLAGSNLTNGRILPLCDTEEDNGIALTIDNRVVGAGSGHPTAPDHPCGSGTVHTCTTEPDTDIIAVRLVRDGVPLGPIGPCGETTIQLGDRLQVDFLAHDPDAHLAYYALSAHFGENGVVNLLDPGLSATLSPLPGATVPAAAQVGWNYGLARLQMATAPHWAGGAIRLEVDATAVFEVTCCYLLRLRAYKRTIVNCNDNYPHHNVSEYSFMVTV